MKTMRTLIVCVSIFSTFFSFAQKFQTEGYWAGKIAEKDSYEDGIVLLLYITESKARQIEYRQEEDKFYYVDHPKEIFSNLKNNLVFIWQNSGEVWSETQTFMLSSISDTEINVLWIRQVNNQGDAVNEDWNIIREGVLIKYTERELAAAMRL